MELIVNMTIIVQAVQLLKAGRETDSIGLKLARFNYLLFTFGLILYSMFLEATDT